MATQAGRRLERGTPSPAPPGAPATPSPSGAHLSPPPSSARVLPPPSSPRPSPTEPVGADGAVAVTARAVVEDPLHTGALVGEYQLTEKIGEGGMGVVWGGIHPVIGKKVAIKLLNPGLSQDPSIVQRFLQEARAVNQIGHRNIVDIFAFGQLPSGRHYFVMEHLKGRSLKTRLEEDPRLCHAHAYAVLAEVADALAAAHAHDIVHRDLKPDNIYLVGGGGDAAPEVKLLDFGIAKLLRRGEDLGQTRTGAPIGTPYYMSPEQCRSKGVDARTDIYAMGVIMFEMFTGRLPFAGADYIDTVNAHLGTPPPLPTDFADLPVALESLILACLEKDPDRRPQHAEELRAALRELAAAAGDDARVLPLPQRSVPFSRTSPSSGTSHPTSTVPSAPFRKATPAPVARPARSRAPVVLGALGLVLLAGAAALVASRRHAAAPAPGLVDLEVVSEPPGAVVTLDGRGQAQPTPATFHVPRAAEFVVRVEKHGYRPYDTVVRVDAGVTQKALLAQLSPLPATLRAHVNAPDGSWLVDGKAAGSGASLVVPELAAGTHRLRVEARGFEPREEPVALAPGETAAVDWTLTPAPRRKRSVAHAAVPDAPNLDFKAPR